MARVAVLVGSIGRGSNMVALAQACQRGDVNATISVVLGHRADAPALERARELGLAVAVVPTGDGAALVQTLRAQEAEWLCLAGYMRLVPAQVLSAMSGRVLNIHPGLLPKFGGKGMYGQSVHQAVLAAGEIESGCTVHYVTERYDEGEILIQMRCTVHPDDTPESLAARVLVLEHEAYWRALQEAITREERVA